MAAVGLIVLVAALASACAGPSRAEPPARSGGLTLVVRNARVTTQDAGRPEAQAFAVRDGVFVVVGSDEDVADFPGSRVLVVDAGGRRVIPGLDDSHLHAVRGGRFYNLELRWDGVDSLERALAMVTEQAARTPERQWVRVIGGWSPQQFRERRIPTVAELNRAAPDTPVFVLLLYSRGLLNAAGVRALQLAPGSLAPAGGRFEFVDGGAILHAEPSPVILYETIAKLPELSASDQLNSTRHFFRELNRFGLTSVVDPGGGGHAWPADYAATRRLAGEPRFPLRISNYLFPQRPGRELIDVGRWTAQEQLDLNLAVDRLNGLVVEGAGEMLVASASDYENFLAPRPELKAKMEAELAAVARLLAERQWPIRIHATYDESITRILDVFEPIFDETGYRARWCIDHVETISAENIARIRALGGGVAIQDRMAFAGEDFAQRYGLEAASRAPPLRALLEAGVPLGAGTDGTRVSSYNPWPAIAWMTTGKTVGGTTLLATGQRLSRDEALRLYTLGSAWFSGEETLKGRIAPGQYADFAILTDDLFAVGDEALAGIESALTVVGGDVVYAGASFAELAPPALPPVSPEWSPVAHFGGYQRRSP